MILQLCKTTSSIRWSNTSKQSKYKNWRKKTNSSNC